MFEKPLALVTLSNYPYSIFFLSKSNHIVLLDTKKLYKLNQNSCEIKNHNFNF